MNVFTLWFFGIVGCASLTILIGVPVWALSRDPGRFWP
jgi:hypothetical protein